VGGPDLPRFRLGEMAFLLHVPRSMTPSPPRRCKLIEIDQERFNELLDAKLPPPTS